MYGITLKVTVCAAILLMMGTALAFSAPTQTAQSGTSTGRMQEIRARVQKLSAELGVTDTQKSQIKPIIKNAFLQVRTIRQDKSLTLEQQTDQIDAVRTTARHQVLALLTPAQKTKLQQMIASHGRQ